MFLVSPSWANILHSQSLSRWFLTRFWDTYPPSFNLVKTYEEKRCMSMSSASSLSNLTVIKLGRSSWIGMMELDWNRNSTYFIPKLTISSFAHWPRSNLFVSRWASCPHSDLNILLSLSMKRHSHQDKYLHGIIVHRIRSILIDSTEIPVAFSILWYLQTLRWLTCTVTATGCLILSSSLML